MTTLAPKSALNGTVRAFLVVLPALIIFIFDVFSRQADLAPTVALRLTAGQLCQQGLSPYTDFWDWAQPSAYWLFSLPFFVNQIIEKIPYYIPPQNTFKFFLLILTFLSLALTLKIIDDAGKQVVDDKFKNQIEQLPLPVAAGYVLALFYTRFQFGCLQEIFILTLMPWLVLRWLGYRGIRCASWLGLIVGLLLAPGMLIDLPHGLIVLGLEIFFILAYRTFLLERSMQALALLSLADFGYLSFLPGPVNQAFWQWTMPVRWRQFYRFDTALSAYSASPDRRDVLYLLAVASFCALFLQSRQDFLRPLAALALLGFALYVAEGDGLSHSLVVAVWAICFCLTTSWIVLFEMLCQRYRVPEKIAKFSFVIKSITCLTLFIGALFWQTVFNSAQDKVRMDAVRCDQGGKKTILDTVNKYSKSGDNVIILADYPPAIFPLMFYLDRRPGSYLLWSRPLRVFDALHHLNSMTDNMRAFETVLYRNLERDIAEARSPLILISHNAIKSAVQNSILIPALNDRYEMVGQCYYCAENNREPQEYAGFDQAFDIYRRR